MRALLLAGVVAVGWVNPTLAVPAFTFDFSPAEYNTDPTNKIQFTAVIVNTGSSNITGISGAYANVGTISPYINYAQFGTIGPQSFFDEFSGINLAPGREFAFIFATLGFANSIPGIYTALINTSISLSDANGASSLIPSTNDPILNVSVMAVPEPTSLALLGMGVAGIAARRRRRTM